MRGGESRLDNDMAGYGIGLGQSREFKAVTNQKARILVVDDRPANLEAVESILEDLGEEIVKAGSGKEALRILLKDDFAVILLDVKMPGMDGFETATLIRERERSRYTPILFLTAHREEEEHLSRGYYAGAVDFLYKPINPEVLRSKVAVFVDLNKKTELLKKHAEMLEVRNRELEKLVAEKERAEESIRRLNLQLEQRVSERTRELSRSNEDLRQFAYAASHDLQEPLRTVGNFTELLSQRMKNVEDQDAQEFMSYIIDGVRRMNTLVKDLLAYSQVSHGHIESVNLASADAVFQAAVMNLSVAIRESGATVTHDPLPDVLIDFGQLTQIFQNLIGNAIKYKGEQPPVVHVSAEEKETHWIFSFRDNGIGIDPAYKDQVFGIFKRLHGREYPGTGMGLAICKKIIDRYGGEMWVESQPSEGSDFRFSIPK